ERQRGLADSGRAAEGHDRVGRGQRQLGAVDDRVLAFAAEHVDLVSDTRVERSALQAEVSLVHRDVSPEKPQPGRSLPSRSGRFVTIGHNLCKTRQRAAGLKTGSL